MLLLALGPNPMFEFGCLFFWGLHGAHCRVLPGCAIAHYFKWEVEDLHVNWRLLVSALFFEIGIVSGPFELTV